MAANMKDIKLRIKSVESTMQITKAMELVATSKLRRAKLRAESARPYFDTLHAALREIAYTNTDFSSPYVQKRAVKRICYVIIAGDRGLAGGYNSNLFKAVEAHHAKHPDAEMVTLPVGKKAVDYCLRNGLPVLTQQFAVAEQFGVGTCYAAAQMLCSHFLKQEFDAVYVAYTNFVSMLSQSPGVLKALPIHHDKQNSAELKAQNLILYEPGTHAVFDAIVPQYVGGLLYGAQCESVASELGARRTAMDAATKNAGEMIETLSLKYNRARQGAITQEITEIVAGADA